MRTGITQVVQPFVVDAGSEGILAVVVRDAVGSFKSHETQPG